MTSFMPDDIEKLFEDNNYQLNASLSSRVRKLIRQDRETFFQEIFEEIRDNYGFAEYLSIATVLSHVEDDFKYAKDAIEYYSSLDSDIFEYELSRRKSLDGQLILTTRDWYIFSHVFNIFANLKRFQWLNESILIYESVYARGKDKVFQDTCNHARLLLTKRTLKYSPQQMKDFTFTSESKVFIISRLLSQKKI